MSTRKLKRLKCVPGSITETLTRHGVDNCKEFLSRNALELMSYTNLDYYSIRRLQVDVSREIAPKCVLLKDLYTNGTQEKVMSTTLTPLDRCLNGGIPFGALTEITGPPGVGKTQFCLMASVIAASPKEIGGLEGGVIYIDTETAFSASRFIEILRHRLRSHGNDEKLKSIASRVKVHHESTCQGLRQRLRLLQEEIAVHQIQLIIIDSVASLIRKEYSMENDYNERNNFILEVAGVLKYLAENFHIPIVVTNQITTKHREKSRDTDSTNDTYITAALGNTWAHAVNTRLVFQFKDSNVREVLVAKSPCSPCLCFTYDIFEGGLRMRTDDDDIKESRPQECSRLRIRTKPL